jgi:hypothetical protein
MIMRTMIMVYSKPVWPIWAVGVASYQGCEISKYKTARTLVLEVSKRLSQLPSKNKKNG